jgi:hypothetical protein
LIPEDLICKVDEIAKWTFYEFVKVDGLTKSPFCSLREHFGRSYDVQLKC